MSRSPDPGRIVAVPCEGADVLALYDLERGDPLGRIDVGSHPVHATVHAGTTFVATMGERSVTAVLPDGTAVRVPLGVLGPSHFATIDDTIFVACTASDIVAAVDPGASGSPDDGDAPSLTDRIAVGSEPHELTVDPLREMLLVGSRRAGRVGFVDPRRREALGTVDAGEGARVQGVAVTADGEFGFAVDQAGGRVVGFDPGPPADGKDVTTTCEAPVGADPYDLVVTDNRVLVPGRGDGLVHEFDHTLSSVAVHEGFTRPTDLFALDGTWWVLDAGDPTLRALDGRVVDVGSPGLVATVVDERLLVSHYHDNAISLVDPREGDDAVVWRRETPSLPFGAVVV